MPRFRKAMVKKVLRSSIIVLIIVLFTQVLYAATVDELQKQIDSHTTTIKQLEDEINRYQTELTRTSAQAKDLQGAVQTLNLNSQKLSADINVTKNKIDTTNLTIQQLALQILDKQKKIDDNHDALASTLRTINESDSQSLLESLLNYPDLGHFWNDVDSIGQFQSKVQDNVTELKALQAALLQNKNLTEQKKQELVGLKGQLADQKTIVENNKSEKQKLLVQTKSQESSYKQLIADRQAKKKAFEAELYQYESQLKLAIDPNSIPAARTGVLAWPLADHVITQYFGNTDFALAHAQLYNGLGHNGIDLKASIGTPILAAGSGIILGTGNTDTVCPGASYGKWVVIQHPNGLSTLYAHLSLIKVSGGQQVSTGDIIGYSGMTGYATGPHLHFTVYASQGMKIISRKSQACGGTYTLPVADFQAYLNPLNFL